MMNNVRYSIGLLITLLLLAEHFDITLQQRQQAVGTTCRTPTQTTGTCINIRNCQILFDLLLTRGREPAIRDLLRQSQCGYDGRDPKVCCPGGASTTSSTSTTTTTTEGRIPISKPPEIVDFSQCGKNTNGSAIRIVGGQPAELGAWPWMAALGYVTSSSRIPAFRCGGTLVTTRHVITASHCVTHLGNYRLSVVRLGDLDLTDNVPDGASPITVPVGSVISHPQYSPSPVTNDIAIIRLQNPIMYNSLIRPLCLPSSPQMRSESFARRLPIIIGWGATVWRGPPSTTALMQAQVPTVENMKCKENYAAERGAVIDDRVICAGGNGNDTCQGDSGGPLILPNGTTYYLIGVVSFGIRCAEPNYPGVYTRVTHFIDWIESNLR